MQNTLVLSHPIMVNNKSLSELTYDADEITTSMFMEAEAKRKRASGKDIFISVSAQFDFGLQLYMGFAAILAVNPELDFADVERIHGMDLIDVMTIGANFLLKREVSPQNSSEKQSETTPEPSTQAPKTSSGKE